MKSIYRCEFIFRGCQYCVRHDGDVEDLTNGFWINADLQFTDKSDFKYWIPPSKIEYISRDNIR